MEIDIESKLEVIKRGVVDIVEYDELRQKLYNSKKNSKPLRIKAGFDPTAPDLHLGHTLLLNKLRQFQDLGHRVIFLIGDFTGMIGDPSGRSQTRKPLTSDEVRENAKTYERQVFKILKPELTEIVFNSEWLGKLTTHDVINLSSRYTVARMLERDDFKSRFKKNIPISIHEFLYPLFQAYDSVFLKADVEIGGSDQRFNLLLAREIQREYGVPHQVVIMLPLLEGLDGVKKMSKSYNNYIGITEEPFSIFSKIMSVSDELMWRYFSLLSSKSNEEIENLKSYGNPMEAKKLLAYEIVERLYNGDEAERAKMRFENIFSKRELPEDIEVVEFKSDDKEVWIAQILKSTGILPSTSECTRLIKQGGIKVDGIKVKDSNLKLKSNQTYLFQIGRRRFKKVKIVE